MQWKQNKLETDLAAFSVQERTNQSRTRDLEVRALAADVRDGELREREMAVGALEAALAPREARVVQLLPELEHWKAESVRTQQLQADLEIRERAMAAQVFYHSFQVHLACMSIRCR